MGAQADDGQVTAQGLFPPADGSGGGQAVHVGHLHVHQH